MMRLLSFLFILMFCCEAKYVPEDGIYAVAETMPKYKGGMEVFNTYIKQSLEKAEKKDSGSVFIAFVINDKGKMEDLKVVKSLNEQCDVMALEIIKNAPGDWSPGFSEGKPVSVKMVVPIHFSF
ncbi:MAG: energy transducer TonB [Cyclobacteriaceae bacterium]|nr:energy transducer TonB [Cyclobacteriaceae bacterium HetDA_MAG_MS6]